MSENHVIGQAAKVARAVTNHVNRTSLLESP